MNRKHLTGCCPSCCNSELLWMCPWQTDFSICSGFVCDTGSQRNSCSTTVVFSVQGTLCTVCLWVQHLGNMAKAVCLAHYSPRCSSWKWHPTSQQCWGCSFGTQAPRCRTVALSVSNTATLEDPWSDSFGRAPFLLSPRQQQLVSGGVSWYWHGGILSNKPFRALHAWEGLSCPLLLLLVNSDNEWVEHWRNVSFEHWDYWILVDCHHRENLC